MLVDGSESGGANADLLFPSHMRILIASSSASFHVPVVCCIRHTISAIVTQDTFITTGQWCSISEAKIDREPTGFRTDGKVRDTEIEGL